MKPNNNDPWMMVGDFNELKWQGFIYLFFFIFFCKHKRGELYGRFQGGFILPRLHDLSFVRAPWACSNKREGPRNVRVKFDRVVANRFGAIYFYYSRMKQLMCDLDEANVLFLAGS